MRTYDAANLAAIRSGRVIMRDFLSITARSTVDNSDVLDSYWSGSGTKQADVFNLDTGLVESRTFKGAGALIDVSTIAYVANLTVQTVEITGSSVSGDLIVVLRANNAKQAKIQLWTGFYSTDTMQQLAAAEPTFDGFLDTMALDDGEVAGETKITLSVKSMVQQLVRSNPAKRSHENQLARDPADMFFKDAATTGSWELFWGRANK